MAEGSIQDIAEIPEAIRATYRTVWEIPMRSLIDMMADRGAFIDQSASLNLFMESPNIPRALALCRKLGLKFDIMATSFFLGRRSIVPSAHSGMPLWQDRLFIFLMKNAANPTDFYKIPPGRVVELGAQVTV